METLPSYLLTVYNIAINSISASIMLIMLLAVVDMLQLQNIFHACDMTYLQRLIITPSTVKTLLNFL